jgi:threonine 3-dehydrogenase
MNSTLNILSIARDYKMAQVFVPSSIAVFGPSTPLENTPNDGILKPTTMYGITKVCEAIMLILILPR